MHATTAKYRIKEAPNMTYKVIDFTCIRILEHIKLGQLILLFVWYLPRVMLTNGKSVVTIGDDTVVDDIH